MSAGLCVSRGSIRMRLFGDGDGAGIYNNRTRLALPVLALSDTTIDDSIAGNDGGGIASFGNAIITNSTISHNSAKKSAGAILMSSGNLKLSNTTVVGMPRRRVCRDRNC